MIFARDHIQRELQGDSAMLYNIFQCVAHFDSAIAHQRRVVPLNQEDLQKNIPCSNSTISVL